jgi:signal transduction histidine kinase
MPAALRSARTRILASYMVLLAFSTLATVIVIRQILLVRNDNEVEQTLVQESREFRQLVNGRDPRTGEPFGDDLARIFDVFLDRNVPDDDEAFVALLDGRVYDSVGDRRFPIEGLEAAEDWSSIREAEQREIETSAGPARYIVVPVALSGRLQGHFVVLEFMRQDRQEVDAAVRIAALVGLGVLAIASLLAYFAAGRVLAPLRGLRRTAHAITESDLSRRIEVEGDDEIADLARTFNDMLDRVEAAFERVEAAFETQRDFINDASHELRTPIAIVRGHLELMGDDADERRQTVELVTDELDRMARMVEDLLLLAKAERSDFLELKPVPLTDLAAELLAKARGLAPRDWQLEANAPVTIRADRQRLTQAIMSLADNAARHTDGGDRITIGVAHRGGSVRLWVSDSGPGIAAADQRRIFERFARGSRGPRRTDGAGLGLAIVKAIAEAHGGEVRVDSAPGQGATFTIEVPARETRQDAAPREGVIA